LIAGQLVFEDTVIKSPFILKQPLLYADVSIKDGLEQIIPIDKI